MNEEIKLKIFNKIQEKADTHGYIERKEALHIIGNRLTLWNIKGEIFDEMVRQGFINPLNKKVILDSIIDMGLIEIINRDKLRVVKK